MNEEKSVLEKLREERERIDAEIKWYDAVEIEKDEIKYLKGELRKRKNILLRGFRRIGRKVTGR